MPAHMAAHMAMAIAAYMAASMLAHIAARMLAGMLAVAAMAASMAATMPKREVRTALERSSNSGFELQSNSALSEPRVAIGAIQKDQTLPLGHSRILC